jgi:signal transduction histidine kinase/CheY-like chemotaxis protein
MNLSPAPRSVRPRSAPWLDRALGGLRVDDRPLATKLALLLALGSSLTALFACVAVMAVGWRSVDMHQHDESREVARMVAYALQAPVAFADAKGVADSLGVLSARGDVSSAWVWSADEKLLGSIGSGAPLRPSADRGGLWQGWSDTTQAINPGDGSASLGHVVIRTNLIEYRELLLAQAVAVVLGALFALGSSLLLVRPLARRLARPLVELADAASDIATGHHYEYRLTMAGRDEVGRAVQAFNAMIDEVAARGAALTTANRGLEQRVAERTAALEREKERAEAASLAKTRFLANMSHELRTPLNGVIGAAQLLRDQGDEVHRRHELVEIIRSSGNSLLGLIDSVLDLARIENGSLTLDGEDFDLADAVEAVAMTAAAAARAKGLQLVCDIDPTLAVWRHGDSLRLRQLLLNLLGNATKFTLHGEVVLRVSAAADAVCFEVRDTGVGMTEATVAHIFEPFRQAEDGSTRRFGGSGLGLAICREVVTLMGGRIEVASQLQQGSTFTVTLPLPRIAAPPSAPPLGYRVAYIEPHEASARALASLLARMGCQALPCRSADDLRAAMALPDDQGRPPWLLVASDDANSLELMQAAADDIDPQRVIGMDHAEWYAADAARDGLHLARSVIKPVLRAALVSRFGAAQRAIAAPVSAAGDADTGARAQRAGRVLVVEDDPVNQTIVASMLTQAGFSVEVAHDGYSALQTFGAMRFDLVLMDWQMPDMDGLEVTRRLRAGAAGGRGLTTPIVALTANAFAEDRAACLAAGMNDFLTKPVRVDQLVRTVNRWIEAPATERSLEPV